jgi:hypothetical protein
MSGCRNYPNREYYRYCIEHKQYEERREPSTSSSAPALPRYENKPSSSLMTPRNGSTASSGSVATSGSDQVDVYAEMNLNNNVTEDIDYSK